MKTSYNEDKINASAAEDIVEVRGGDTSKAHFMKAVVQWGVGRLN